MITAKVTVTLKDGVLDPQGKTIHAALKDLGYESVQGVATGKIFVVKLSETDRRVAEGIIQEVCRKLLANPVIEQYRIELET